ncbi:MAG: extracellular solute-binding protein [Candidatus Bathyarchaeota archaeon]|jgi:ABC-type Fe3+ transport system substrate-binding protein|nr:extracellular solute-binding protein [Candidatus Bathyarchaeota archaeon]
MAMRGMRLFAVVAIVIIVGGVAAWLYYSQGVEHKLVVIHPHSAAFADYVVDDFVDWVEETQGYTITVSQQTPGGSGIVLEQIFAWEGIPEADIYWGGGNFNFEEAANLHSWSPTPTNDSLLLPYTTANDADIDAEFNGWAMKEFNEDEDTENPVFYAAALSGFGFMWNTEYLAANNLSTPETYSDLLTPQYHDHIVMCNPKTSGSTTASVLGMTQFLTAEEGWTQALSYWGNLTGNVGLFVTESEDVPAKVVAGEYGVGICLDYYAFDPLREGSPVGFAYWPTTVSPDPAAILKGATNLEEAQLFMDYITSERGQTAVSYYRLPTREDVVTTDPVVNPFNLTQFSTLIPDYDVDLHNSLFSRIRQVTNDWLVTNHAAAMEAYELIKQCEEENTVGTNYQNAVAAFNAVPENVDTLDELKSVDYRDSAVQEGWENWGAAQFQEAIDEATLELAG